MPILKVQTIVKPDAESCKRLIRRLTDIVIEELDVPAQSVNVLIEHIEPTSWGVGGQDLETLLNSKFN